MASDPMQRFISQWGEGAAELRSAGVSEEEIVEILGSPSEDDLRQELTEDEEALLERIAAAIEAAAGGDGGQ